jgi:HTH-type transcriptional regulator/antitoxin HipB
MSSTIRSSKSFGQALRRARRAAGLTQAELGAQTQLRQATVSNLENGEGATLDTVFAVLTALKLDLTLGDRASDTPALDDIF